MSMIGMAVNKPILSIIVPVYNVEKYISNCIESLLKQDISTQDYEIIFVDDGSPDCSMDIVSRYSCHDNIVQIWQNNQGVSSARNKGIEEAKGDYLIFVDADDEIEENSLNAIVAELKRTNVEILLLNSYIYENGRKGKGAYRFPKNLTGNIISGIELFKKGYVKGNVCSAVFKRHFIIDYKLRFSEKLKNGEDTLFMTIAFLYAHAICHLDVDFYKVKRRKGSASQTSDYNSVKAILNSLYEVEYFINTNSLTLDKLSLLNIYSYGVISNALYYLFSIHCFNRYDEIKKIILNSSLYPIKTYGVKLFRYKIFLLNYSIDLFSLYFIARQIYRDTKILFLNKLNY